MVSIIAKTPNDLGPKNFAIKIFAGIERNLPITAESAMYLASSTIFFAFPNSF